MMKAKTTTAFDALNPQQRRAATFGTPVKDKGVSAGPLLILAGAGTGKTNTLAHRTAHLVLNGVDPARILMLTFTRRAAQEMIRRTQTIVTEVLSDRGKLGRSQRDSRGCCGPAPSIRWATGSCGCIAKHLGLESELHGARPRRCGRPHGRDPPRAGLLEQGQALSAQGCVPRDLQLSGQHAPVAQADPRGAVSLGARMGSRTSPACTASTSAASRRTTCWISTICCSTGTR